jgi:glycosyltransferase involved in cell wall biosynthesis
MSIPEACPLRVAHLTSAHPRDDIRVFLKQCRSLARAGFETHLVVADGLGDAVVDGVRVHDVGAPGGRLARMFHASRRVADRALGLGVDICHLHDPELLLHALRLRRAGKSVIFDAHEDVPRQLLGKPYLGQVRRQVLSWVFARFERFVSSRLDAVIGATPAIARRFQALNGLTVEVNNYPMPGELAFGSAEWTSGRNRVAYVGGIAQARGIREVVAALALTKSAVRLQLAGSFSESATEQAVKSDAGWAHVDELGMVSRGGVAELLARSVAGLVTFHDLPNHVDAQPNKMFEYMSAGIPVIASDFPLWREIVEGNRCGICVEPTDPAAIARAIDHLVTHPEEAAEMGRNGLLAVQSRYNWSVEEAKLIDLYQRLSGRRAGSRGPAAGRRVVQS